MTFVNTDDVDMEGEHCVWGGSSCLGRWSPCELHIEGFEDCWPQFAEYVVERLGIVIQALSSILMPLEDQEEDDLIELRSSLEEISTCCHSLGVLWQSYIDEMDSDLIAGELEMERFQVPRVIDGCGCPRAVVT